MTYRTAAIAFLPAALLASCGGTGGADADNDGQITEEEVRAEASNIQINPGQWENTVEFTAIEMDESAVPAEARGMMSAILDGMVGQTVTASQCITEEEANQPEASFFSGNEDADCDYDRFTLSGGNMDMAMTCRNPDGSTANIAMTGTYTENRYELNTNISTQAGEMGQMTISASTVGERTGACE